MPQANNFLEAQRLANSPGSEGGSAYMQEGQMANEQTPTPTASVPATKPDTNKRRLAAVSISGETLVDILRGRGDFRVVVGLPADAELVAVERKPYYADDTNAVFLVVRSAKFEEVPAGRLIPELPIAIQTIPFQEQ